MLQHILTTYLLPLLIYGAITGLANLLLSHKSQIESYAQAYPKWSGVLKMLRAVGFDPWNFVSAISLWAQKRLPDAQQNGAKAVAAWRTIARASTIIDQPPPPKPPSIPPLAAAGLFLIALILAASCSPADIAAERKAAADGQAKLDQYCDARAHALQSPDGGEAGSK